MTEQEWLDCADPFQMLEFLRRKASDRKLRLFAVACCRMIWPVLTDERSRRAVEVAERFAEGLASEGERAQSWESAYEAVQGQNPMRWANVAAARVVVGKHQQRSWVSRAAHTLEAIRHVAYWPSQHTAQNAILRDIVGPLPFRPIAADPAWITPTVVSLATAIYDDRAFNRMPILADALTDAGCDNQDILQHCRSIQQHVRGCFVVDLLLGKS